DVLLIDQHNYHTFQPLLYQVATAGLESEEIAYPVRAIIRRWKGVRFMMARVEGVDTERKEVRTSQGAQPYDYLVVAAGSVTNDFGLPGVAEHGFGLKTLDEAERLRNHILTLFERSAYEADPALRAAMRTFVVVGGGPTGVEFAGALRELVKHVLVRDFPDMQASDVRVILLEATDKVLAALPANLQRHALDRLRRMGVEVRLQASVTAVEPARVRLKEGEPIPSHTLLWAAGIRGIDLETTAELTWQRGKRIAVGPDLAVAGQPELFVIGDLAYLEAGKAPLPQVAPVAIQQGALAAENIRRRIAGQPAKHFAYRDRGTMATIGRGSAVARIFGLSFWGFPAWVVWLVVHLMSLVGFRNRVLVLVNWAYDYFFYERAVRLITGDQRGAAPRPAEPLPAEQPTQREQHAGAGQG
ncbi:MAG TPA: NAD(P)/FAD-dependent oxidoreductase, partial [Herpetosiphonaceae bacterium]